MAAQRWKDADAEPPSPSVMALLTIASSPKFTVCWSPIRSIELHEGGEVSPFCNRWKAGAYACTPIRFSVAKRQTCDARCTALICMREPSRLPLSMLRQRPCHQDSGGDLIRHVRPIALCTTFSFDACTSNMTEGSFRERTRASAIWPLFNSTQAVSVERKLLSTRVPIASDQRQRPRTRLTANLHRRNGADT